MKPIPKEIRKRISEYKTAVKKARKLLERERELGAKITSIQKQHDIAVRVCDKLEAPLINVLYAHYPPEVAREIFQNL
jgi:hypothetical protein